MQIHFENCLVNNELLKQHKIKSDHIKRSKSQYAKKKNK